MTSSPLAPPVPPSLTIKEESEDDEEEVKHYLDYYFFKIMSVYDELSCEPYDSNVNFISHFISFVFFSTSGGRRGSGAEGHRAGDGPGQCVTGQGHPRTETQQERHCECYHGEQERGGGGGGRV